MLIVAQADAFGQHGGLGFAVGVHNEIGNVAGMRPLRVVEAMFLAVRIEMRAGGLEVWAFALGGLMNVNAVVAWRQIMHIELGGNADRGLLQRGAADILALAILQLDHLRGRLAALGPGSGKQEQDRACDFQDQETSAALLLLHGVLLNSRIVPFLTLAAQLQAQKHWRWRCYNRGIDAVRKPHCSASAANTYA